MNRRKLLLSGGSVVVSPFLLDNFVSGAFAQGADDIEVIGDLPPLPDDLKEFADSPPAPYTELSAVGKQRPTDTEIIKALEILLASPYDTDHLEVARYFFNLSEDKAKFKREWPLRANPMIYHFFSATRTRPEGDVTPWCAAVLNWFLLRAKAKTEDEIGASPGAFSFSAKPFSKDNLKRYSTQSASSGSFRCLEDSATPSPGDIIVLANAGTESMSAQCLGTGHVSIFLERLNSSTVVGLGGNQSSPGSNGAITKARISTDPSSRFLKFVRPPQ